MKIRQCLLSFPICVLVFICLLVSIICYNSYVTNYKHRLAIKQLMVSSAMLQAIEAESVHGVKRVVSDKLSQLKKLERNADELNNYSQLASVFILLGSLLLGGVFLYNIHRISTKLKKLSVEVKSIHEHGLHTGNLHYAFDDNATDNEIDCLATGIEKVLQDYKKDSRRTNFMVRLLQECNRELKQQIQLPGSSLVH